MQSEQAAGDDADADDAEGQAPAQEGQRRNQRADEQQLGVNPLRRQHRPFNSLQPELAFNQPMSGEVCSTRCNHVNKGALSGRSFIQPTENRSPVTAEPVPTTALLPPRPGLSGARLRLFETALDLFGE